VLRRKKSQNRKKRCFGDDVMVTIMGDFRHFSAKKNRRFPQKQCYDQSFVKSSSSLIKTPIFSPNFLPNFLAKIFLNDHTGRWSTCL
jgi:hypothetical protein